MLRERTGRRAFNLAVVGGSAPSSYFLLRRALKAGARVGIVDIERPTSEHGTPIKLLRCELFAVGYHEIATYQLAGDGGYLAVFSPPEGAGRKSPRDIVACGDRAGTR